MTISTCSGGFAPRNGAASCGLRVSQASRLALISSSHRLSAVESCFFDAAIAAAASAGSRRRSIVSH